MTSCFDLPCSGPGPESRKPSSVCSLARNSQMRKEFFPNKHFKLRMLDLINSGEQSPGKCLSFQLSSFWLCLFFLNSRSLKMHSLKYPGLSHTEKSVQSHERNAEMIHSTWHLTQGISVFQHPQKVKTILISVSLEKNWG